jgi:predicted DNA-binding protein (UPF0251 family)
MPREKSTRKLNFKPIVESFIPSDGKPNGVSVLLHEEIEAIYLMDVLNLYQEDAAKSMEVSRPTFTRIIKSARQKVAKALISGYKIEIQSTKKDTTVAFCSSDLNELNKTDPLQENIYIYSIEGGNIELIKTLKNPVFSKKLKPAIVLPEVLLENKVNIFISSSIGEGLKNSLISKGIRPLVQKEIDLNSIPS